MVKKGKHSTCFQLTAYLGTQTLCMKKVTPVTKNAEGIQPILDWLLILAKHFLSHILSHVINQSPLEIMAVSGNMRLHKLRFFVVVFFF